MAYNGTGALPGTITYVEPGDSVATIQSKMDLVQPGNSLVFVGSSTYDFDNTTITGKSGVTVWAEGPVTIENAPGAGTHGAFDFSGQSDWTIGGTAPGAGFIFDGSLIDATNASGNWTIGNSQFNNEATNGFDGSAIRMNGASFGTLINNDFNNVGGNVVGMYNLTNITIDGNHFTNTYEPISLQEPTTADTSLGRDIVIERNVFIGTQRAAIEVGPASSGSEYFSGLVINDNYFDNFNNTAGAGTLLAISAVGLASENTTITNNYINRGPANAGEIGVAIEIAGSGVISGNAISNFSYGALTYQSGWDVHDNTVLNDNSSPYFGFANNGGGSGTFAAETVSAGSASIPAIPVRVAWGGPITSTDTSSVLPPSSPVSASDLPATLTGSLGAGSSTDGSSTEAAATAVTNATFANGHVTLSGTSDAGSGVMVFEGLNLVGTATADSSGHWTIAGNGQAGVFHSYGAVSVDTSGNVEQSAHDYSPGDDAAAHLTSAGFSDTASTASTTVAAAGQQAGPTSLTVSPAIVDATDGNNHLVLQGISEADSSVSIYDGNALVGTVDAGDSGSFSFATAADNGSVHSYSATAIDSSGNSSTIVGQVFVGSVAADTIKGTAGPDVIAGGGGADILSAGKGPDTFVYFAALDSSPTASDKITGFQHGVDKIDFTNIAGISTTGGVPTFQGQLADIGNVALAAHSVAYVESGGSTLVLANTSALPETVSATDTHNADMKIELVGVHLGLTATDFHHM